MFTPLFRDRVRERVLQLAATDERVVAGAVVGSLAHTAGDRWSDLDLTFAVADELPVSEVLDDWTRVMAGEFDAAVLFDLPRGSSIYRVFLLPGCLQVDLSFTPAADFGAIGPRFRLLFGSSVPKPQIGEPPAGELFGYAAHHALRARLCIERERPWQAEYWISSLRDYALSLECLRHGRSTHYGRGLDELPPEVLQRFSGSLVASLERAELLRALECVIDALLSDDTGVEALAAKVAPQLRMLTQEWEDQHP